MLAEVRLTSSTETLPVTVAGQKKKGDSKILSLMKESKDDERKEERIASQPFFLSCPGLAVVII